MTWNTTRYAQNTNSAAVLKLHKFFVRDDGVLHVAERQRHSFAVCQTTLDGPISICWATTRVRPDPRPYILKFTALRQAGSKHVREDVRVLDD